MQTGSSGELRSPVGAADARGKHRVSAELKRLEQETRFLELFCFTFMNVRNPTHDICSPSISKRICNSDPSPPFYVEHFGSPNLSACGVFVTCNSTQRAQEELEQLEKMEKASAACKEVLSNIETRPDPLLPVTNGPINPIWDRWFEGPQDSSGCRCRIL